MAGKGGILIVLLLLCSGCSCISSVASAGGVLVARPMDGDMCIGDDENAEFIVDKGECTFVMCAPGYELNSKGVCAIPTGEVGDKEGFMAPGSVTGVVGEGGNTDPNPDDCGGNWSEWGECTGGKQSRYWTTTKLPRGGGAPCPTLTQEIRDCGGQDSGAGAATNAEGAATNAEGMADIGEILHTTIQSSFGTTAPAPTGECYMKSPRARSCRGGCSGTVKSSCSTQCCNWRT